MTAQRRHEQGGFPDSIRQRNSERLRSLFVMSLSVAWLNCLSFLAVFGCAARASKGNMSSGMEVMVPLRWPGRFEMNGNVVIPATRERLV